MDFVPLRTWLFDMVFYCWFCRTSLAFVELNLCKEIVCEWFERSCFFKKNRHFQKWLKSRNRQTTQYVKQKLGIFHTFIHVTLSSSSHNLTLLSHCNTVSVSQVVFSLHKNHRFNILYKYTYESLGFIFCFVRLPLLPQVTFGKDVACFGLVHWCWSNVKDIF